MLSVYLTLMLRLLCKIMKDLILKIFPKSYKYLKSASKVNSFPPAQHSSLNLVQKKFIYFHLEYDGFMLEYEFLWKWTLAFTQFSLLSSYSTTVSNGNGMEKNGYHFWRFQHLKWILKRVFYISIFFLQDFLLTKIILKLFLRVIKNK